MRLTYTINMNPMMVKWYGTFLQHRHLITEYNGTIYEGNVGIGFPQGGVCSAKFWIVAFNEAIKIINQYGALGIGFADDCCILLHRPHINHAMSIIQRIVDQLVSWGNNQGLTFNPTKTVCIQFTRATDKTRILPARLLQIYGTEIPLSQDTRYLGVQLDEKLTWNKHFDMVAKKSKIYLSLMTHTLAKHWGPKPRLVKWIYTAIVKPRITYAALVWAQSVKTIGKKQRLGQITRLAAMLLTPTRKKAPTAELEIIHDIMPLELALQEAALNTFTRLRLNYKSKSYKTPKNLSLVPHLKYLQQLANDALGHTIDSETTMANIEEKNYWVTINPKKGRANPIPSQINIYTDGSKTSQGTGAGYVILQGRNEVIQTQSVNLTNNASIFQAELIAIEQAAQFTLTLPGIQDKYIKIFSDSQAALQALQSNTCTANTTKLTHEALNVLGASAKQLRLTWVNAHVGLDGNELADKYAKLGKVDHTNQIQTTTTRKEVRNLIQEFMYHKWREKWTSLKKCRMTKRFYKGPDRRVGNVVARMSRENLAIYVQAITGHNNLNYMNSIIIPGYTSLCRFCEEEDETFDHLYEECPVFWGARRHIRGRDTEREGWTPQQIIRVARIPDIQEALCTNVTEDLAKTGKEDRTK